MLADRLRTRRRGWYAGALLALAAVPTATGGSIEAAPRLAARSDTTRVAQRDARYLLAEWREGPAAGATAAVLDPLLAERIEHLRGAYPEFRAAWDDLSAAGIPLVIGSSDQLASVMPREIRESGYWAGITLTWPKGRKGELHRGAVAIRIEWLRDLHAHYGNPPEVFLAALDGLLIHEVYGHLVPVVAARNLSAFCADPVRGERLSDSCVGKRELALKRSGSSLAAGLAN